MNEFFQVISIRQKAADGTFVNTVYNEATMTSAQKRFFTQISMYLDDAQYDYFAAYVLRSDGITLEARVFDKRGESAEPAEETEG